MNGIETNILTAGVTAFLWVLFFISVYPQYFTNYLLFRYRDSIGDWIASIISWSFLLLPCGAVVVLAKHYI